MIKTLKISGLIIAPLFFAAACSSSSDGTTQLDPTGQVKFTGAASSSVTATAGREVAHKFDPPEGGCVDCSPDLVGLKIEQLWLGEKADCSDVTKVVDKGAAAEYVEMTTGPTLIDNDVAPGTYNCLIIKMSDIIRFSPNDIAETETIGVCLEAENYSHDIFRSNESGGDSEFWYDAEAGALLQAEGTRQTAVNEDIVQSVFIYFVTDYTIPAGGSADAPEASVLGVNPDINPHQLLALSSPVVVVESETTPGVFYFDFDNQVVVEDVTYCTLEAPDAGFNLP
mgnify:CR=1 FL=1